MSSGENAVKSKKLSERFDVRTFTMIGALLILWLVFSYFTDGSFIKVRNISNLLRQMAIVGILGTGMVLVIVTGNIDLSVGSVVGFIGGLAAALQVWQGWSTPAVVATALAAGLVIGLLQGYIVSYLSVPAFIVTLGGMLLFKGGLLGVTKGVSIAPFNESFIYVGVAYLDKTFGLILGIVIVALYALARFNKRKSRAKYGFELESIPALFGKVLFVAVLAIGSIVLLNSYNGIPMPVLLMAVLMAIFTFVAEKTTFGRSIYAMGGNIEATKYSGINVRKNLLVVFILNGMLASIAGMVLAARLNAGAPTSGDKMELDAIAAAVIGGTSMSGGSGRVIGAALGALFMATINNGMSMMNMDAYWQYMVKGVILVTAVWFDIYTKNKK